MQSTEDQASLITQETPTDSLPSRQPDYNARVDHGTSYVLQRMLLRMLADTV
jgi:hypothetical protein